MSFPLTELQRAHQQLLSRYMVVLEATRTAKWLMVQHSEIVAPVEGKRQPKSFRDRIRSLFTRANPNAAHGRKTAVRSLVHLFVEGHIRKKLRELSAAYVALRAQAPADDTALREWAKEGSESCEKMADTLATWASVEGGMRLLWPLAVGAFTAWLGVEDMWQAFKKLEARVYFLTYAILLFPAIYMCIFMSSAFGYKRELFTPGYDANEHPFNPESGAPEGNLYILEDRVFSLLGARKSRERPWDIYFIAAGCFFFGSVPFWGLFSGESPDILLWISGGFFWLLMLVALLRVGKRKWR